MEQPEGFEVLGSKAAHAAARAEQDRNQRVLEAALRGHSAADLSRAGWSAVPGLEMPTAMHAHAAITVPLLPNNGKLGEPAVGDG